MQEPSNTSALGSKGLMSFGEFLRSLVQALVKQGVSPCILRNYEGFPDNNVGNDVDFMIHPAELPLAIRAIRSIEGVRIVGYNEQFHVAMVFIEGISPTPGVRAFQVDFIRSFTWKGLPYLSTDAVLTTALTHHQGNLTFLTPSAIHEAIISLLTSLVVSGFVKEKYFPKVQQTFANNRDQVISVLIPAFGSKQTTRLVDSAIAGDRQRMLACISPLRLALSMRRLSRRPIRSLAAFVRHNLIVLGVRLLPRTLETVCILGADSDVKSATVELLMPKLRYVAPEVNRHNPGARFQSGSKHRETTTGVQPPSTSQQGSIGSMTKALGWLLDEWLSQFMGRKNLTLRIRDNSYSDLLADPRRFGYAGPMGFARFVGKLFPPADLWILLEEAPEGWQRKELERPSGEARARSTAYRSLLNAKQNHDVVDASQSADRLSESIYAAIIDALSQRANKRLKACS
jgi:hypothetical protein